MIEIRNLSKDFEDVKVLKDINLTIGDGDIYGLVGASGVGKSTLLGCINGLENYQNGSIIVDGVRVEELQGKKMREFRKNMGMIFQNFSLVNRKSVYQNIAIPMECWGVPKEKIKDKVYELAETVGLKDRLHSRPGELSGGQKQRVAIARALTLNPQYILCDECTSALDPKTTISILELLKSIRDRMGITIIVVTHEMSVVQQLCNKMAILEEGRVSGEGDVAELFLKKSPALQKLLGEGAQIQPEKGINVSFHLSADTIDNPVLWEMARTAQKQFSLVDSKFYEFQSQKYCSMVVNIADEDKTEIEKYLRNHGISYEIFRNEGGLC